YGMRGSRSLRETETSELIARSPATTKETPRDVRTPPCGMSQSSTSRVILPPSRGQIGNRFKIGHQRLIDHNWNKTISRNRLTPGDKLSAGKAKSVTSQISPRRTNWAPGPAKETAIRFQRPLRLLLPIARPPKLYSTMWP